MHIHLRKIPGCTDGPWEEFYLVAEVDSEMKEKDERIKELETEHLNKPPEERVHCLGCSLPSRVKELEAVMDTLEKGG
jgi:hypothetical protein